MSYIKHVFIRLAAGPCGPEWKSPQAGHILGLHDDVSNMYSLTGSK